MPALTVHAPEPVDFSRRATQAELMDGEDLDSAVYARVIADLAQVNTVIMGRRPTLWWLDRATRGLDSFRLLDVGFAQGDMLRAIARWAQRRGKTVELVGIDLNPGSAPVAQAATDPRLGIRYLTGDAFQLRSEFDIIISSLTTHHMPDADLVRFLAWMDGRARHGWLTSDLHRHPVAWAGFLALATVMRWHPIVRHDGALSVRRSFTRADWDRLLAEAGIAADISWHLPFRWTVGRVR